MKKVMFAAAVAASMVAFGAGEITSANVVGYQTRDVDQGFSLSTPAFAEVGGGEYKISDIKLSDDAKGEGNDQIQVLNSKGSVENTYIWLNQTGASMDPGWYDISTWEPITGTIGSDKGFLMYTDDTKGLKIMTSGEVGTKAVTLPFPAGFSVFGNGSPVDINVQDIKLADDAKGEGNDQIQVLNSKGSVENTYIWLNQTGASMDPGWYDISTWEPITATIKAGEALLMYTDTATSVTFPAALQ